MSTIGVNASRKRCYEKDGMRRANGLNRIGVRNGTGRRSLPGCGLPLRRSDRPAERWRQCPPQLAGSTGPVQGGSSAEVQPGRLPGTAPPGSEGIRPPRTGWNWWSTPVRRSSPARPLRPEVLSANENGDDDLASADPSGLVDAPNVTSARRRRLLKYRGRTRNPDLPNTVTVETAASPADNGATVPGGLGRDRVL